MGNNFNCLNRNDNIDNIIKRTNELNEDFYAVHNKDKKYHSIKDDKLLNNSQYISNQRNIVSSNSKYKSLNKSEKYLIFNLEDLKKSQIIKLKRLIDFFNQNGKPRSSDDFDPNNWKKFYSKDNPFFCIKGNDIVHNQLKVYNPNNINNIRIYQGDLNKKGQRHGIGKYITPYYVLMGMWKDDKFSGWGRESRCNGDVFEGRFVNGLINGKGIFMDIDKNKYIGDFINVKRWGIGKWITNKIIYDGEFYNNQIHGKGRIKFLKSGIVYIGTFKKDKIDGYGIFKWLNGDKYEGEVKNGKMHGLGKYFYNNGKVYNGLFVNGKIDNRKEDLKSLNKKTSKIPFQKNDNKTNNIYSKYKYDFNLYNGDNNFQIKKKYMSKINNDYNTYNNKSYPKLKNKNEIDITYKNIVKSPNNNKAFSKSLINNNNDKNNNYYVKKTNKIGSYEISKENIEYKTINNDFKNNPINKQYEPIQENTEYLINNYDFLKLSKFKKSTDIENEKNDKNRNNEYNLENNLKLNELGIYEDNVKNNYESKNNQNSYENNLIEGNILYEKYFNLYEVKQNTVHYNNKDLSKKNSQTLEKKENSNNTYDLYNFFKFNEFLSGKDSDDFIYNNVDMNNFFNGEKQIIKKDNINNVNNQSYINKTENIQKNINNNNNLGNKINNNKTQNLQKNININNNYGLGNQVNNNIKEFKKKMSANILLSTYRNFGFGDNN